MSGNYFSWNGWQPSWIFPKIHSISKSPRKSKYKVLESIWSQSSSIDVEILLQPAGDRTAGQTDGGHFIVPLPKAGDNLDCQTKGCRTNILSDQWAVWLMGVGPAKAWFNITFKNHWLWVGLNSFKADLFPHPPSGVKLCLWSYHSGLPSNRLLGMARQYASLTPNNLRKFAPWVSGSWIFCHTKHGPLQKNHWLWPWWFVAYLF